MKKKLKIDRIVLVLFFTISLIILIKNIFSIFSRYQIEASTTGDVDVAYYFITDNVQTLNLNVDGIGTGESVEKVFTVSNNNGVIRSQTAMEFDIKITATTYLPLVYSIYQKIDDQYILIDPDSNPNITDVISQSLADNLWYHYVTATNFSLGYSADETKEFKVVVTFPQLNSATNTSWGGELADIMENITLTVEARQKITE